MLVQPESIGWHNSMITQTCPAAPFLISRRSR